MRQESVRGVPSMGGVDTLILTASWRRSCAGTKERTQRAESESPSCLSARRRGAHSFSCRELALRGPWRSWEQVAGSIVKPGAEKPAGPAGMADDAPARPQVVKCKCSPCSDLLPRRRKVIGSLDFLISQRQTFSVCKYQKCYRIFLLSVGK